MSTMETTMTVMVEGLLVPEKAFVEAAHRLYFLDPRMRGPEDLDAFRDALERAAAEHWNAHKGSDEDPMLQELVAIRQLLERMEARDRDGVLGNMSDAALALVLLRLGGAAGLKPEDQSDLRQDAPEA